MSDFDLDDCFENKQTLHPLLVHMFIPILIYIMFIPSFVYSSEDTEDDSTEEVLVDKFGNTISVKGGNHGEHNSDSNSSPLPWCQGDECETPKELESQTYTGTDSAPASCKTPVKNEEKLTLGDCG